MLHAKGQPNYGTEQTQRTRDEKINSNHRYSVGMCHVSPSLRAVLPYHLVHLLLHLLQLIKPGVDWSIVVSLHKVNLVYDVLPENARELSSLILAHVTPSDHRERGASQRRRRQAVSRDSSACRSPLGVTV